MSSREEPPTSEVPIEAEDPALERLLVYLRDSRGFDFSGYKRATLVRRIRKRMGEVSVADYEDYVDFLEANPREFVALFNTILINVTGFFRDPDAWRHVQDEIVPKIVEAVPDDEQIRVWSAGCASGEEAYTAAIVLLEVLGEEAFERRVKIYATDIDEDARYPLSSDRPDAPKTPPGINSSRIDQQRRIGRHHRHDLT